MILNAQITGADIFIEDHDILTFNLTVKSSGGWTTNIGSFYLDWTNKEAKRVPAIYTSTVIRAILETVGVRSWNALVGKYIRIDDNDKRNSTVYKIGNILEDKWINIRDIVEVDVCV